MTKPQFGSLTREYGAFVAGPSRFKVWLIVPKGTLCRKLGDRHWVVQDLNWLADNQGRRSITYHDAQHYGIPVDRDAIELATDVKA